MNMVKHGNADNDDAEDERSKRCSGVYWGGEDAVTTRGRGRQTAEDKR